MVIRNQRAFCAGALFLTVSIFFFVVALGYTQGTAARMGPGFFPRMVSSILGLIGLGIMIAAVMPKADIEKLEKWDLKGLIWIAGAVAVFAFLLQPLGLVISLAVLIIIASKASPEFTWLGAVVNTVVLIAFAVGVFVYGIGLQFPVWPTLFNN